MLYQFPPPEWFEPGTTSALLLNISLWAIIIGLPVSVLTFWLFPPRSRIAWILAEVFWGALAIVSVSLCIPIWAFVVFYNAPQSILMAALLVMSLLPIPAAIAGWKAVKSKGQEPAAFRTLHGGCLITGLPVALFLFHVLLYAGHCPIEAARRSHCKNNLRHIGLAFHNFHDVAGRFTDSQIRSEKLPPHSWRVELLPFLEHADLFDTYNQAETWDSISNQPLARQEVNGFICPSMPEFFRKDSQGRWYSAFATLNGPHTAFADAQGLTIKEIWDGLSNTALVAEACGQQIIWTEPRDVDISDKNLGINLPGERLGKSPSTWSSYHKGGANTLLADGSVRFLNANTDPRVLRAITTASAGESISEF